MTGGAEVPALETDEHERKILLKDMADCERLGLRVGGWEADKFARVIRDADKATTLFFQLAAAQADTCPAWMERAHEAEEKARQYGLDAERLEQELAAEKAAREAAESSVRDREQRLADKDRRARRAEARLAAVTDALKEVRAKFSAEYASDGRVLSASLSGEFRDLIAILDRATLASPVDQKGDG